LIIEQRYTPKMPAPHLRLFALVLVALLASGCASVGPTMRLHFIDVGQGAATLVEFPCAAVLVDTGGESNPEFSSNEHLSRYLDRFFDERADLGRRLDLLVLTHPHLDHTRGVKMVLERHRPRFIVTNGREDGSGRHGQIAAHAFASAQVEGVRESAVPAGGLSSLVIDPIDCDSVDPELRVLWGSLGEERAEKNGNNHSVVLRVGFGRASVLFSGDLETEMIGELVARHRSSGALDVDVYQVGHHGSYNGTTPELLAAMTPKHAVIAVGRPGRQHMWTAWAFGHPRAPVVDALEAELSETRGPKRVLVGVGTKQFEARVVKRAIYATGWDGDVVLEAGLDGSWHAVAADN
jgi:competence protein ComEC